MKKAIIIIVGILLVIIISAVFILPRLITLDKFKGRIEDSLEASLNREVSLGDISLALWPGIGAEVKDVTIANLAGFSKGDFVRIKSLQVLIQILPLLSGNIEVDKCILTEPRLWIEKNAAGKFNFSDLLEAEKEVAGEKPIPEEKEIPRFIKGLMVSKAAIDDAEVHYADYSRPGKKGISLEDVDLHLKNISIDRPVELDLSFQLQEVPEKVHVKGTVGPLGKEMDIASSPVTIFLESKDLELKPLGKFLENGSNLGGLLSLRLAVKGKANEALNLDLDGSIKGLSYNEKKKMLVKDMDVAIKEKAILNLKEEEVIVQTGQVSSGDLLVTMGGKVSRITSQPDLDVSITAKDFPLSGWDTKFPTVDVLAGLGGKGDINVSLKGRVDSVIHSKGSTHVKGLSYSDKKTQKVVVKDFSTQIDHAVSVNLKKSVADIRSLDLTLKGCPIHITGTISQLEKPQPYLNLSVAAKGLSLSGWDKTFPAVEPIAGLTGTGDINWLVKGKMDSDFYVSGTTSLKQLTYKDPETRKTLVQNLDLKINHPLALDMKREVLDIKNLRLELQGTPVAIKGMINQFKEHPYVDLKVAAQNIPLKKWQQAFPLLQEMVDLKGDVTLGANFKGKLDKLIDASVLLNSGQLEIDRVKQMNPGPQKRQSIEQKAQTQVGAVIKGKEGVKAEGEIADRINLVGKVTIGQGRFENIRFNNLSADLTKKGKLFELSNMVFHTFKGKITAKGRVDMQGAIPRFSFATKVDGAEVNQVYNTFASPKDLLFGLLATDFTMDGVGFKEEELTKNLNASGRLNLKDGRITSFDLLREIALIAKLMGVETHGIETRFDDLSMGFSIKSGKIFTDNLSLTMKDMKMAASGYIGLDKTIDLSARAWLSPRFKMPGFTQYAFEKDENGRVIVPFRLAGTLLKPKLALDTTALKTRVQKEIKEQIEKGVEKIPVEKELKEIFKDVLPKRKK